MDCVCTMLLFLLKILKQAFARPTLLASFFGLLCSCSEKAEIKSYSIPSEYDGPIVSWVLPSVWIRVKRDPIYGNDPYAYKFGRRLVDNLLPRKVMMFFIVTIVS